VKLRPKALFRKERRGMKMKRPLIKALAVFLALLLGAVAMWRTARPKLN